ncbi:hypothetical protein HU200_043880 [Digitaria exilis]|uniref:Uncharacterized protein n=1 Tax=Digitaria exilis TaxID=1010633 RepID=A0A835EFZ4_9POAL|nr:hypothetical protein HU200_043880 [Digitaria exilis]
MEATITSEVQSLCRPLDAAPPDSAELFFQELLAKRNQHAIAIHMTRDILMYMERTFIPINGKAPIHQRARAPPVPCGMTKWPARTRSGRGSSRRGRTGGWCKQDAHGPWR